MENKFISTYGEYDLDNNNKILDRVKKELRDVDVDELTDHMVHSILINYYLLLLRDENIINTNISDLTDISKELCNKLINNNYIMNPTIVAEVVSQYFNNQSDFDNMLITIDYLIVLNKYNMDYLKLEIEKNS